MPLGHALRDHVELPDQAIAGPDGNDESAVHQLENPAYGSSGAHLSGGAGA